MNREYTAFEASRYSMREAKRSIALTGLCVALLGVLLLYIFTI